MLRQHREWLQSFLLPCRLDQPRHVDEYIRAICCEHKLRDVDGGAITQSVRRVCTRKSPSRSSGLTLELRQGVWRMLNTVNVFLHRA